MTNKDKAMQIVKEIKEGRIYTIAGSMCEDYYWYKDGKFHTSFENGVEDSKDIYVSEERVISEILRAMADPSLFDIFPDFGT